MKTVLHFLSAVRWENLAADSNFEVFLKTVRWLPAWHHYVLVPWREISTVTDLMPEVSYSLLSYEYPSNILAARHEFRSAEFAERINLRKMDIDFLFCHQPELLGNLLAAFSAKRANDALVSFVFFHWVDCPGSRGSAATVPTRYRQLEAAALANRFFVHGPHVVNQYLQEAVAAKAAYMPLSGAVLPEPEEPPDWQEPRRPFVVFNHRRSRSTGWQKLESWLPDGFDIVYTGQYTRAEYRWILERAHCVVCMIMGYCTWNLAIQDPVRLGVPLVCQCHPTLRDILKSSALWFDSKEEFQSQIRNARVVPGTLEDFDANFRSNLLGALRATEVKIEARRQNGSRHTAAWKSEIAGQPGISKAALIRHVHGKTASAHASWQYVRRDLLREGYRSSVVNNETVWHGPTNTNTNP